MSDEEKEAIEILKLYFGDNPTLNITKYVNIVLNLIEKQQKEIEELKTTKKELTERVLRLESDKFWDNVVSKDKIKSKIEEYKKQQKEEPDAYLCIKVLQSLLEKE